MAEDAYECFTGETEDYDNFCREVHQILEYLGGGREEISRSASHDWNEIFDSDDFPRLLLNSMTEAGILYQRSAIGDITSEQSAFGINADDWVEEAESPDPLSTNPELKDERHRD